MAKSEPNRSRSPLDEAEHAYDAGDYARARRLCAALMTGPEDAQRRAAELLFCKMAVDRFQLAVLGGCAVLFLAVVVTYFL